MKDKSHDQALVLSGRIVILANPAAGRGDRKALGSFAAALAGPDRRIDIVTSDGPGDMRRLAREIDADYVFVAGGDGSINEVVAGLVARAGARPVLGILPQGTVNVLADELGLPRDPATLARAYLAARIGQLHYGVANDRPFVLMVSAGLDAEVVSALRPGLKRMIGRVAYIIEALRLVGRKSPLLEIDTDAGRFVARLVIFANASRYGGNFIVAPGAAVLRPGLRMIALADVSLPALLRLGYYLMRGDIAASGLIETAAPRRAFVRAASPVATQMDGDAFGVTPLDLRDAEQSLALLLPQERPDE
jgi:diacylglycerol kinase (ATP)